MDRKLMAQVVQRLTLLAGGPPALLVKPVPARLAQADVGALRT